jgi:SAM-dependent methyltransferase
MDEAVPEPERDPTELLAAHYSGSACSYARWWSPFLRSIGERLVETLPLSGAVRVLDVGSGAGGLTSALKAAAPRAVVIGVDVSEGMLRLARAISRDPLAVMDAQSLAVRSTSIDVAVCAFVLFHLPDPARGLQEMARTLRRGGAVGSVTWGVDRAAPLLEIWNEELDAHGAGPDPMPAAVEQHAVVDAPVKISALLEAAGFAGIRVWSARSEYRWDPEHLFEARQGFAMKRRLLTLTPNVRAACLVRIRERLSHVPSDALVSRPEVVFATARRRQ